MLNVTQLYPAIDVRDGRVVRLRQGNYEAETRYHDDPLALARDFFHAGANWLHLVDLNAARSGHWSLAPLVSAIKDQTGLKVQSGGGIRCENDLIHLFSSGVNRAVIGSMAIRETDLVCEWIGKYGADRIAIALDAKQADDGQWQLPIHGWTEGTGVQLNSLLSRLKGSKVRHVLSTDINRDGMLSGLNFDLYSAIQNQMPSLQIQCSGGIRDLDDVRQARQQKYSGVVLGRALLEGRITLQAALAC